LTARPAFLFTRERRRQDFQRQHPAAGPVSRLMHISHAALAEQADNVVFAELGLGAKGVIIRRYRPKPPHRYATLKGSRRRVSAISA